MDINELKSKVLEQAQQSELLAQNKRALEKQVKDTIAKNFKEIVKPFMAEMNKLIKSISDMSATSIKYGPGESYVKLFLGEKVPDCYYFGLSKNWNGIYTVFGRKSDSYYNRWDTDLITQTADWWNNDNILKLSYWFLTEEKSQEFVEVVKEYYVELLEKYSELVKARNEQLSQSITELTEELKRASSVEHKEDGTVEIHLGGKTYKATLKEE